MALLAEAGVALIGGHSIKDDEIKLGFAVTGLIDPDVAAGLERARIGDVLVLTKPLGTGVLAFARQIGWGRAEDLCSADASMATLNKRAAEAMIEAGASACTDVTGFGLLGHLLRLARQSKVTAQVFAGRAAGISRRSRSLARGSDSRRGRAQPRVPGRSHGGGTRREPGFLELGCDAQTSGGLLIAVAPERLGVLQEALRRRLTPGVVIGRVVAESEGRILLSPAGETAAGDPSLAQATSPRGRSGEVEQSSKQVTLKKPVWTNIHRQSTRTPQNAARNHFESKSKPGTVLEAQKGFGAMLRAVQSRGVLEPEDQRADPAEPGHP